MYLIFVLSLAISVFLAISNQKAIADPQPSIKDRSSFSKTSSNRNSTPSQLDTSSLPDIIHKPSPTANAVEVEKSTELFHEGNDKPASRPDHPPIGLIPPMPMPDDSIEPPKSTGTGKGIISDTEVNSLKKSPSKIPAENKKSYNDESFKKIDREK